MATTEESAQAGGAADSGPVHGGRLVARTLKERGVSHLFTLSGGHLFSIYDGCKAEGIKVIDTRHEASAAWAAEGWAKATRQVGVCALTAGPGVTNGMSAIAGAKFNRSPLVVLGGRAPEMRWGSGSLQEIDHIPFVSPLVKSAGTVKDPAEIPAALGAAIDLAMSHPTGPVFLDFPLDVVFSEAEASVPEPLVERPSVADNVDEARELLAAAERPAIMAGTGVYWALGETSLQVLAEKLQAPVFLNGMGRGCLPADHDLYFSRARGRGLKEADVALVAGVPLDFRLGFGGSFGEDTKIVYLDCTPNELKRNRLPDVNLTGDIAGTLMALAPDGDVPDHSAWLETLRETEAEKRAAEEPELNDDRSPLHPMRIYKELKEVLPRDAIVIGDGGDFVSFAGKVIDTYEPGTWMDPGPFGCLGAGPGQAIGAKLAHPDKQVVLLLGDGAFGFSAMEFDTMARHNIAVTAIIGNNGIWALEHHPMKFLYGYSMAAELTPETRYDEVAAALGCDGEAISSPEAVRKAFGRALESERPFLFNALTDPAVVYPRKANLA